MLSTATGNLLQADVDALVNTVNTVGVMGKGIAFQFRKAYPDMFAAYAKACKAGEVELGHMQVWETGALDGPPLHHQLSHEGHWRAGSKLRDIEAETPDLVQVVAERGITSIAVPPLGCGNGGLDWADVEPRIRSAFAALPHVDVRLYAPGSDTGRRKDAERNQQAGHVRGPSSAGDPRRPILHGLTRRHPSRSAEADVLPASPGEPLQLGYARNRYGPYADNLRHVLNAVEGHYLTGYGNAGAHAYSRPNPSAPFPAQQRRRHPSWPSTPPR